MKSCDNCGEHAETQAVDVTEAAATLLGLSPDVYELCDYCKSQVEAAS